MHNEHHFKVGHRTCGANRVKIALHKLPVAAPLRVFATPHAGHLIPLERRADRSDMLRTKPSQWHGQIKPHSHIAAAMVFESVELFICLVPSLSNQNIQILKGWGINRCKAVGTVDPTRDIQNIFASQRLRRQVVAKPF